MVVQITGDTPFVVRGAASAGGAMRGVIATASWQELVPVSTAESRRGPVVVQATDGTAGHDVLVMPSDAQPTTTTLAFRLQPIANVGGVDATGGSNTVTLHTTKAIWVRRATANDANVVAFVPDDSIADLDLDA